MFVIPRTKHIESRIFDLPLPLRPVMELNDSSLSKSAQAEIEAAVATYQPEMTVRTAYDLKPSTTISMILMVSSTWWMRRFCCGHWSDVYFAMSTNTDVGGPCTYPDWSGTTSARASGKGRRGGRTHEPRRHDRRHKHRHWSPYWRSPSPSLVAIN
jgi:hypothetical protein